MKKPNNPAPSPPCASTITVGKFGRVYGVHGWVHVISYTQPLEQICQYQPWIVATKPQQAKHQVTDSKLHGNGLVVKLQGIDECDTAASLTNQAILIERSQLPALSKDECYWADLIGLTVVNQLGIVLGTVRELFETGANDVIVVEGDKRRLLPYIKQVVLRVDLNHRQLHVDWSEND